MHGRESMKLEEIRQDDMIRDWLESINAKPTTVNLYTISLMHFTEYTGKSPLKLVEEAEDEIREGKLMRQRVIKKMLPGFRRYLQERDMAIEREKRSIALDNVQKIADALEIETYLLFVEGK